MPDGTTRQDAGAALAHPARREGRWFIEQAAFVPGGPGNAGSLLLTGWCSAADAAPGSVTTAWVRLGGEEFRIACDNPRPDVVAFDPRLSLASGFKATLKLTNGLGDADTVRIDFHVDGALCWTGTQPISIAAVAVALGPSAPPTTARWFIETASFLPAATGAGGFLSLTGWCSPIGGSAAAVTTAHLLIGGQRYSIACTAQRPDVAASDPRLRAACGFDATLALPQGLGGARAVRVEFQVDGVFQAGDLPGGAPCGAVVQTVAFPAEEVEQAAATLPPLRLKKLRNLVLNERERLSHAAHTAALPVVGQIDPCFSCQLRCPGCAGHAVREQGFNMKLMTVPQIEAILEKYGDTFIRIWLSLWGEPLLNPHLPALIERCKRRDIFVVISTNLSLPMSDGKAEALVAAAPDSLLLAIDGATQDTYHTYRQGGSLSLALDNARRLVAAKRRLGVAAPALRWRYLCFPWNQHEIEPARALARDIGLDHFELEQGVLDPPFRASLRPAALAADGYAALLEEWRPIAARRRAAHRYFGCDNLYYSISINANGQVHPCCYVVSPADTVGAATQPVAALRNAPALASARDMFGAVAHDRPPGPAALEPCRSCRVVNATDGHVVTQSSFRDLFDHLMGRRAMNW